MDAIKRRRRHKQDTSLAQRLDRAAAKMLEEAWRKPPCAERDQLLRKARQHKEASELASWLASPGETFSW